MKKTETIQYYPLPSQLPELKTKRAAIYIRCSSDEARKEGYSPETQKEKVIKAIQDYGWQINEKCIYSDIGFSGGNDKRPGFQQLLKDAQSKEFEVVVVYRMDRFFRNLRLLLNTVAELRDLGIEFKSVTEPFDTSTPTGRAMFANAGVFAEWMREIGLESRNEGMIKAMKEGKYLSGTPVYGYNFNEKTQKLEPNREELKIVKMMFRWLTEEKLSGYKIQKRMNEMKIPTKYDNLGRKKRTASKGWWNSRTIARILRNEIYASGIFYYRRTINPARTKNENNQRPQTEWIKVENPKLKVLSKSLFEKAQRQLKKNKELASRNTKETYVLQHKIVCGYDGRRYQSARRIYRSSKTGTERKTKYYFCPAIRKNLSPIGCPTSTITESRIVPPVWNKLKELLTNPELIISELDQYQKRENKGKEIREKLEEIKKGLNACQTKKEKYAELYAEESISKNFYNKKTSECDKKTEELQKEQERAFNLFLSEQEKEKRIKSINELHKKLKENIENATYDTKREIIQLLVEKVIKTGEELKIEFNLPILEDSPQFTRSDCEDRRRIY